MRVDFLSIPIYSLETLITLMGGSEKSRSISTSGISCKNRCSLFRGSFFSNFLGCSFLRRLLGRFFGR